MDWSRPLYSYWNWARSRNSWLHRAFATGVPFFTLAAVLLLAFTNSDPSPPPPPTSAPTAMPTQIETPSPTSTVTLTPTPTATATLPSPTRTSTPTATSTSTPTVPPCHPSYPTVCLYRNRGDYDCAGGTGDGPNYVRGLPPDPFDLDRDGDGIGCEA
jgi:hypothetical protein